MTEANESADITVEEEVVAAPEISTVERAEMLLNQDEAIFKRVQEGASLDEAVDPSNKEFGPLAHPEQVQTRVAKRAMMIKDGINPYPVNLDVTTTIDAVRAKYDGKLEAGAETDDIVGVAGRVLFIRNAGGLCFVQLAAGDGTTIQAMLSKKQIGADSLKQFKQLVDLGDHLFVKGRVIASKTGELSIFADEWAIAAKALQPLPTLHKELNEDTRTRKPYIGMIADEKIRNMVRNRSRAVASLRRTFDEHGFLEVETPMLQTIHGGAAARPFTTHMNAFDLDLYLRIAPELFLKRCLVGGIEKVFEINRDFRNEGVDATHAPEFTMVEAYEAYGNYDTIAKLVKELIQKTAIDVFGSTKVTLLDGTEYDFGGEWKTMSMYDSLSEALGQQITPETNSHRVRRLARPRWSSGRSPTVWVWSATRWRTMASSSNTCGNTSTKTSCTSRPSCATSRWRPRRSSRRTAASPAWWRSGTSTCAASSLRQAIPSSTTRSCSVSASWHRPRMRSPVTRRPATSMRTSSRRSASACRRQVAWAWASTVCSSRSPAPRSARRSRSRWSSRSTTEPCIR